MTDPKLKRDRIFGFPWFHSIDFGGGLVTPGVVPLERLQLMANAFFPFSIRGKSLLDVGSHDGFFAIDAHRRGANVLATDKFVWQSTKRQFEIARDALAPELRDKEIDVLDISSETVGLHDITLFSGVLYHMRHPLLALERVASVTKELLVVESHMDALNETKPAMIFYPGNELNNDRTNWWGPNRTCIEAMLADVGFPSVAFTPHRDISIRGIFHARR